MEIYNGTTVLAFSELVGPILSKPNYDKQVRLGYIKIARKGGNGRTALIDYQSLPERIKSIYTSMHQGEQEQLIKEEMKRTIKDDPKAIEFFKTYQINNTGITDVLQAKYYLNAQVLNEMIAFEKEMQSLLKRMGTNRSHDGKKHTVWQDVYQVCEDLRQEYNHTLPSHEGKLREKFNAYKRNGYRVIVSGKVGNNNRRKINEEEARLVLKLKRSRVPIYTDMQIFEEFNRQAEMRGFEKLKSPKTIKNYLNEPSVKPLWVAAVRGEQAWKNQFTASQKTELPSMRDSLWYSDGTKLNIFYRDEKNVIRTTAVYEVLDSYSEVFLGYDIAPTECFDSQYRAFRMAIEFAGHKPYEIVNDNQGGHKKAGAIGFFDRLAKLQRRTAPYSAPSKTIESVFGRFQKHYMNALWQFTGQNITAVSPDSHINREFLEANAKAGKLPTLEEAKALYLECRNQWNNGKHYKTGLPRMEMYLSSVNPDTPEVTEIDMVQMFWICTKQPVAYTNKGIEVVINNIKYEYQVYEKNNPMVRDDNWALKNTGRKFFVYYDPYNMTCIELWEDTPTGKKFTIEATPKISIHRGLQERTEEETIAMRAQLDNNKRTRIMAHFTMEDFDIDEMINPEYYGLVTPKPKGFSDKEFDRYRNLYEKGKIEADMFLPGDKKEKRNNRTETDEEIYAEPVTLGEYTKAVSNIDECDYLNKILGKF